MCLAERERDPSGCRASGLTPERLRGAGSVAAGSAAFARCGGNDNSVDFTRAGHRIVQSMLRLSFFKHLRHTGANVYPTDTSQSS